jgi:ribonuclease HI
LGLGVVVWDSHGNFCAAKGKMWTGWLDPTSTEAWAALMAIDLCHDLGVQRVILEGDAKSLVDAVNSTERDDSCRGQLVADIQLSVTSFQDWQMVYAPRQVNRIAHCLAQQALKGNLDEGRRNDPPESIQMLIETVRAALNFDVG